MSASLDPVTEFLRARGCAPHVVEFGLAGLLASWARTADELAGGYRFGLDDYLNDVDARQILEEALQHADDEQREAYRAAVSLIDERVDALLGPPGECLWGAAAARAQAWTPERNWWYFRWPLRVHRSEHEAGLEGA